MIGDGKIPDVNGFLADLLALSQKYDLWISKGFTLAGNLPQVRKGYGDETGYEVGVLDRGHGSVTHHLKLLSPTEDRM